MAPVRILIADDHTLVRQGLHQLCEGLGNFTVVAEAENGVRAVELAHTSQPDVILMDIAMPEMDGTCPADSIINGEGGSLSASASVSDLAGNSTSKTVTVQIDQTAPSIYASATAGEYIYFSGTWTKENVIVSFECFDDLSGVASVTDPIVVSAEGSAQSVSGSCTDQAGNSASTTFGDIQIDKTNPTLSPTVSPNPVFLNGTATVTSGAADALSGLASQSCGPLDTSTVGSKSVTCTATDNAGNTNSANASYSVIYNFTGFFQPVDNLPMLNSVKAGQAIPVKFNLGGDQGLGIMAAGYPVSTATACGTTATDVIEETMTAGSSSLSYDATTGQYNYVWKTDKAWANTCRTLTVKFIDGTIHQANFKFTK